MDLSYIINVLGEEGTEGANAISPPIYQTSNFYYKTVEHFRRALLDERNQLIYSRGNNPTINLLCKKLAALEETEDALVFGSGMAAISSTLLAMVSTGDHIVSVQNPYSWTDTLMNRNILPKYGIEVTMVDACRPENIFEEVKANTKLIYLESPNSWTFELQDLQAVADFARNRDIITMIDNSYSTPLFQKPANFGIDLVVHTMSKYISGHSDTVAGACCGSRKLMDKIFSNEFLTLGSIISPFNAWLILRGLRTLPVRMERISNSATRIINFLEQKSQVKQTFYPFSKQNPQFELARKQMTSGSGLFTIQLQTEDAHLIEDFCNKLTCWRMAVSWGGHESLIIPSCSFIRPGAENKLPSNLIRFSVGLEDPEMLIEDLNKNLNALG
jgi:cystathionine beta-lyase/cystathionine gamma-synthase